MSFKPCSLKPWAIAMPTKPPVARMPWVKSKAERLAELRKRTDAQRPSSTQRGYDRDWRELRAAFLKANPICCVPGCGDFSTDADHYLDVRTHPELRLVWQNLRPYCHKHHSSRTARDQGFAKGG